MAQAFVPVASKSEVHVVAHVVDTGVIQRSHQIGGGLGSSVVDDDHLPVRDGLRENAVDCLAEVPEVAVVRNGKRDRGWGSH